VVAIIEGEPFDGRATVSPEPEAVMRTMLRQSLATYEIPRHVYFVPKLLETPTGKVDRWANVARLATQGNKRTGK
jgi:acyl-CoA synthetase (AMP-forming)/AMP-acid ligase II